MKKILLSLFLGLTAIAGMAQTTKTYNEKLVVTVNDVPTDSIPANIQITKNEDGTCDFTLKNFCLISEDEGVIDTTGVGTINLKGVKMETKDGINNITTSQTIAIVPGDDPKIKYWLASIDGMLDAVPIVLTGKIDDTNLYVNIDIEMVSLGQTINVVVGQEMKVTSINTITNNNTKISKRTIYTLNGIPTTNNNLSKGIYIINGKKVIK